MLTGGRFVIGPTSSEQWILGLRTSAGDRDLAWNFRTTDLDAISHAISPCEGSLALNLTARGRTRRLALTLRAPPASFSAPIPVPTPAGFSEVPGCRESYAAVASLVASKRPSPRAPWAELGRWEVPLAVLEFGGTYQCTRG